MPVMGFLVRVGLVTAASAGVFALVADGAPGRATGVTSRPAVTKHASPHAARPVPKGTFTFSAVGDVMMGSMPDLPPDGGASYFSGVQSAIKADVALANLEGTLSTGGASKCGAAGSNCFAFHTPPSSARWLRRAGFTILNVANNHAADFGPVGERQTLAALARERLLHTGRPGEITLVTVHRVRVALIGFAPYPWAQSLTDIGAAKRLVARARKRA